MHLPDAPVALWPPLLAVQGRGDASRAHAHHTIHLVLAREGTMAIRIADASAIEAAGVLTRADVPHAIDARSTSTLILFVDPESSEGARLTVSLDDARTFSADERDALIGDLPAQPSGDALARWIERAIGALAGAPPSERRIHPRIKRLLARLREGAIDRDLSLEALAAEAKLSPSRFMHAFTESVGIPLRPYLRWLKVQRAGAAIVRGASLSEAAIEAGFADAAHMSRTFRDMFGLPPSALQRRGALAASGRREPA